MLDDLRQALERAVSAQNSHERMRMTHRGLLLDFAARACGMLAASIDIVGERVELKSYPAPGGGELIQTWTSERYITVGTRMEKDCSQRLLVGADGLYHVATTRVSLKGAIGTSTTIATATPDQIVDMLRSPDTILTGMLDALNTTAAKHEQAAAALSRKVVEVEQALQRLKPATPASTPQPPSEGRRS